MAERILLDTNVIIGLLRGQAEAVEFFRSLTTRPFVSVVAVGELYAGVRDGAERTQLERLVSAFRVVRLDLAMAIQGGLYARQYSRTHGVGLADGLIAAAAEFAGATLCTLNTRHFPMLSSVRRPF